jgi:hypothetical protein
MTTGDFLAIGVALFAVMMLVIGVTLVISRWAGRK